MLVKLEMEDLQVFIEDFMVMEAERIIEKIGFKEVKNFRFKSFCKLNDKHS